MPHLTPTTLRTRLLMWKLFFETRRDTTPEGATNDGYDCDVLIELARQTTDTNLGYLADVVELQKQTYMMLDDWELTELLCGDGAYPIWNPAMYRLPVPPAVTLDELEAVLKPR